ncbi:MAG TPA: DUF262 domain-containing protein [Acidobacteriaceae bacterium]|jgi:hypothetical protein|nr:DUF262 domain-containing protein [Acidobacteriaceae bacterium]
MTIQSRKKFRVEQMDARTLTWWAARRSKIDMDPPYQRRGRLWSATDKAFLIDSILNEYDVPKVYMADFTWGETRLNRKKLQYAIIDGKQRLEAIFDFLDGKVVLNRDFIFLEEPNLRLGGLSYQDLKKSYPQVAELFDQFNLVVMRVIASGEGPITELFVRLNRSKPLTGAEIRNAMSGPAPELFRQIAKHEFFKQNVAFTSARGQDLNAAAKIVYFEYSSGLKETKKSSLDQFAKVSAKHRKALELAGRKVLDVLDDMSEIFLPNDSLLRSAGVFPVYYWFVRSRALKDFPYVREFLVRFEETRKENRSRDEDDPELDSQLLTYDRLNRSTDDERSHLGRFEALTQKFKSFLAGRNGK